MTAAAAAAWSVDKKAVVKKSLKKQTNIKRQETSHPIFNMSAKYNKVIFRVVQQLPAEEGN